jgi:NodT family efflux transporter outer membrane factor (OMF) lipoprotein
MPYVYLILAFTLFLSACAVGPDYVRPAVTVPTQYKEAQKDWQPAQPRDAHDRGPWWNVFQDPVLNSLQRQVNVSNQNIAFAEAQYQQARALVSQARAAYFPTITSTLSSIHQKQTASTNIGSVSTASGSKGPVTTEMLSFDASWELDLWGGIRRQVESSKAGMEASAAQLAAVRLSMQALLAQNYFELRGLDKRQQILDKAVVAYQKTWKLTQDRFRSGVIAMMDVAQAETQLKVAQAAALDNQVSRAQLEHAIAVLIGQAPANFSLPVTVFAMRPPSIPVQLPASLLERRPDIAQAERNMAAANAQIGVAVAAYFPNFSLLGTLGYRSNDFSRWIMPPALFWSVGPQLAATLFEGGLRQAVTAAARASYAQSVATYRQTVLAAFQNVEDNLVALRILAKEAVVQQQALSAAQLALKLALQNYVAGTTAYTDVLVAQTIAYTAEQNMAALAGRQMVAAVGLITALGGGWQS